MLGTRVLLGVVASLVVGITMLAGLYMDAREGVVEASQRADTLAADLTAATEAQRRLTALLEEERAALAEREREQERSAARLAEARRSLAQIRVAARGETDDASLACAVRPVPDAVDGVLRGDTDD